MLSSLQEKGSDPELIADEAATPDPAEERKARFKALQARAVSLLVPEAFLKSGLLTHVAEIFC